MLGIGVIAGRRRPEYGPEVYDLTCDVCGATWSGEPGMDCEWCARALERLLGDARAALLFPAWLTLDHGPRYTELSDVDKEVWDHTRGHAGGDPAVAWAKRLRRAVAAGVITTAEARAALRRATHG